MTVSQTFLVFYDLDHFEDYWLGILQNELSWALSDRLCVCDQTEVVCFKEENDRCKDPCSPHHVKGACIHAQLLNHV